jgi:hypothetical protein
MGTIQGTGSEVQYTAPGQSMIDTVTVTVTDGKGGTDSEELSIEIKEPSVNRPPQVTIVSAEPSVINDTNLGLDKKLFAVVSDPDGMDDIDQVIADLSAFSGSSGVEMRNDGEYPDDEADDQWYSLLMPDLEDLDNGIYTIKVTVYDRSGDSATGSSQVQVNLSGSQSDDIPIGRDSGPSPVMIGLIIVAVILLISGIAGFFVIRGRRSRPQPPQQPQGYGARFQPPARQPPMQGSFRPVQRQP